jgi:hypothetical protein
MPFPINPSVGDTYVENNTTYEYLGPVNGWYRKEVGPNNDSIYISSDGAPGGVSNDTEVIFNDNGSLASDSGLTYNKTSDTLTSGKYTASLGTEEAPSIYFDPNTGLYSPGADQVAISTNGTGRMRIAQDGKISTFSSDDYVLCTSSATSSTGGAITLRAGATGIGGGTATLLVRHNGNVQNTNDSYGPLVSDIKYKENIVDAGSQWDDFKAIRFRKFNFKPETGFETFTQLGVIAQEVELVSPGLVTETPDLDENGNDLGTTTKTVKSSVLTKKALVALQEAMERIEVLEAKVNALEGN